MAGLLGLHALLLLGLGVGMLAQVPAAGAAWPWALSPENAAYKGPSEPYVGVWLIGIGVVAAQTLYENDLTRLRVAFGTYIVLSVLEAVALARYAGTVDWNRPAAWAMIATLATMLAVGAAGLALGGRAAASPAKEPAVPDDPPDTKPVRFRWEVNTRATVQAAWAAFADTDQFARVARQDFTFREEPQPDGTTRRFGAMKKFGLTFPWDELPFQYRAPKWWKNRRVFHWGPVAQAVTTARVQPTKTGSSVLYTVEIYPRYGLLRPVVAMDLNMDMKPRLERTIDALTHQLDGGEAYEPPPPALAGAALTRLESGLEEVAPAQVGEKLAAFLQAAPLIEQNRMAPLALAWTWKLPRDQVIEGLLSATEAGLLSVHWTLICPSCLAPKAGLGRVLRVKPGEAGGLQQVHCMSCNVYFDGTFPDSVAVHFRPAPSIRDFEVRVDCIGSPARQPHIIAQDQLEAFEDLDFELDLPAGAYRLRTWPPIGTASLEVRPGAMPTSLELKAGAEALDPPLLRAQPGPVKISLRNDTERRLLVVLEKRWRPRDLLTAGEVLERFPRARALLPAGVISQELSSYKGAVLAVGASGPSELLPAEALPGNRLLYRGERGMLAIFPGPEEAVAAARGLLRRDDVTAGLTFGDVLEVEMSGSKVPMGDAVTRALKIMYASPPGGIGIPASDAAAAGMKAALDTSGSVLVPIGFPGPDGEDLHWISPGE